jgi:plastocyanin
MEAIEQRFRVGKRLGLAIALVAVALLVLALRAAGTVSPAGAATALSSAEAKVKIPSFKFSPATLRVAKGTRVLFVNTSGVAHTATDRGVFDSGRIKPGHAVAIRFGQKGTFRYFCKIHPFMHGTIVVG